MQVRLTEKQACRLKSLAATQGVSMAELVCRGVDLLFNGASPDRSDERRQRAMDVRGFRSGIPDLAVNHDRYLAEIYAEAATQARQGVGSDPTHDPLDQLRIPRSRGPNSPKRPPAGAPRDNKIP
jgi:hypothetical protein